jgi:hypothetical protein
MANEVVLYLSNLTSNSETRKQQVRIQDVLSGKKIEFKVVDVSGDKDDLAKMRAIAQDPHALAPQLANGDVYCGNYEAFDNAVESKTLKEFLKL